MNKATVNIVPFILEGRTLKASHHYTVEEVYSLKLNELTEIAILLGLLTPPGWKFRYSFEGGDIVTEARNPTRFYKPSKEVRAIIKARIDREGFIPFTTVKKHFLFLEWEVWEEGEVRGAMSDMAFKHLVSEGVPCWHAQRDVFFFGEDLLVERYDLRKGEDVYLPLKEAGEPSQLLLLLP